MQKSLLNVYLERMSKGDVTCAEKLCNRLADRLVYVPVIEENGAVGNSATKVSVVKINGDNHQSVPMFTDEKALEAWTKENSHEGSWISLLGADFCRALAPDIWVLIDPASNAPVEFPPILVTKVWEEAYADIETIKLPESAVIREVEPAQAAELAVDVAENISESEPTPEPETIEAELHADAPVPDQHPEEDLVAEESAPSLPRGQILSFASVPAEPESVEPEPTEPESVAEIQSAAEPELETQPEIEPTPGPPVEEASKLEPVAAVEISVPVIELAATESVIELSAENEVAVAAPEPAVVATQQPIILSHNPKPTMEFALDPMTDIVPDPSRFDFTLVAQPSAAAIKQLIEAEPEPAKAVEVKPVAQPEQIVAESPKPAVGTQDSPSERFDLIAPKPLAEEPELELSPTPLPIKREMTEYIPERPVIHGRPRTTTGTKIKSWEDIPEVPAEPEPKTPEEAWERSRKSNPALSGSLDLVRLRKIEEDAVEETEEKPAARSFSASILFGGSREPDDSSEESPKKKRGLMSIFGKKNS